MLLAFELDGCPLGRNLGFIISAGWWPLVLDERWPFFKIDTRRLIVH